MHRQCALVNAQTSCFFSLHQRQRPFSLGLCCAMCLGWIPVFQVCRSKRAHSAPTSHKNHLFSLLRRCFHPASCFAYQASFGPENSRCPRSHWAVVSIFSVMILQCLCHLFAVVGITLTLVSVYAPIAFIPDLMGQVFQQFAMALAGSVLISGRTGTDAVAHDVCEFVASRKPARWFVYKETPSRFFANRLRYVHPTHVAPQNQGNFCLHLLLQR